MTARPNKTQARRKSYGEIIELALTRPSRAATEDVTIRENAKHELQLEITACRHEEETLDQTAARALSVFKAARAQLDQWYPQPIGDNLEAKLRESVVEQTARKAAAIARRV